MNAWNHELGTFDLSRDIVRTILSGNKQSERILITGSVGHGKSYTALSLAYNIACYLSLNKYGNIEHWRDFFDPVDNLACINPDSIRDLMLKARKPYNVYILDDVGAGGWQARKFQSAQNTILNKSSPHSESGGI